MTNKNLKIIRNLSHKIERRIEEAKKRNRLLVLYDVDSSIIADELKDNIVQDLEDDLSIEENEIIPRFKTGPRSKPMVH